MIDFEDMVRVLAKPGLEIVTQLTAKEAHILHMAVGLMGEVCELLAATKAANYENAVEELGDIEFYFEGLKQGSNAIIINHNIDYTANPEGILAELVISAGEVLDIVKKIVFYKDPSKMLTLCSNMQSFRCQLDSFYVDSGIERDEVIAINIDKLGKRYEGFKYTNEAAKTRIDKRSTDPLDNIEEIK